VSATVFVDLPGAADTRELGRRLAQLLRAGDLVILDGPLGAGKTVLVQGIAAGLGVTGEVTSPTFVIARVHRPAPSGRGLPLVHVDAYRLRSIAEVDDLDLDTGLDEAVTVVEWGEGKVERLADAHLRVRLSRHDDDTRTAVISGVGAGWWERLRGLATELRETSGSIGAAPARQGGQ
jgi:tRNA threonylcarbamoyladenosine biosynthesis protein TsaE